MLNLIRSTSGDLRTERLPVRRAASGKDAKLQGYRVIQVASGWVLETVSNPAVDLDGSVERERAKVYASEQAAEREGRRRIGGSNG